MENLTVHDDNTLYLTVLISDDTNEKFLKEKLGTRRLRGGGGGV